MRSFLIVVVVAVVVLAPAVAFAQAGPPSKVLERAIKLYDKEDYLSATIELSKVLSGETGDDAANLQRAGFFQAKAVYQLGYYVPSLVLFQQIEADPAHAYRDATLKWVLAIARELPETSGVLETIAHYERGSSAITALGEVYDEYAVMYGRAMVARNDYEAALSSVNMVAKGSPWWPAAQHQRGLVMFRVADAEAGIAATIDAATDPLIAPVAVHDLAFWTRMLGDAASAGAALRALAAGEGPAAAAATFATSRLDVEARGELADLRGLTDTFDALVIVTVCGHGAVSGHSLEGLGGEVLRELTAMARGYDDNAELFDVVRQRLTMDDDVAHALRLSLGLAEPMRWAAELARELALFEQADAAWLTTRIAAELETELELQRALADATAGQWLRNRFELIGGELQRAEDSGVRFAAAPGGDDLVVTAALCDAAGLPHATTSRPTPDALPLTATPKQGRGCGCTTTGGADLGAILLALLVLRRGARRRLTPDRQLE